MTAESSSKREKKKFDGKLNSGTSGGKVLAKDDGKEEEQKFWRENLTVKGLRKSFGEKIKQRKMAEKFAEAKGKSNEKVLVKDGDKRQA